MQIILEDFKAYDDFKNKQKRARTDVFSYVKVYTESLFNTIYKHWDKAQILKKFPSNKISVTKCTLSVFYYEFFFFLRVLLLILGSYMSWSTRFVF